MKPYAKQKETAMKGKGQLMKKQVKGKKGILICFCIIVISVLFFMIYQENAVSFIETTTSFFDGTSTEAEVENQNGAYYKITCKTETFEQDNFLDYSVIEYPVIEFAEGVVEDGLENKINRLLYETARLRYSKDLEDEINACYGCTYYILSADEKYICIYYEETIGGAIGRPINFEDGLTISLKTGEKVSLNEWKEIDQVFKEVNNYRGVIYTSRPFDKSKWEENKDDFIEEWKEDENAEYHGYYLYDGRLGLLFNYYETGREKIALEFEGIL